MSAIQYRILPRNQDQANADKQRAQLNRALLITLFVAPGMIVFLLFLLIPICQSFVYSQYKWNGLGALTDYVGFDNYDRLIHQPIFQMSLGHSFVIMALSLLIQLPLALGLALMVGRGQFRGKKLFRTIFFVPFVFSEIVCSLIWL